MIINNFHLTIVNYSIKTLIIKNGMFFDLLKNCLQDDDDEKNNKNMTFVLTVLTAYHHHYRNI